MFLTESLGALWQIRHMRFPKQLLGDAARDEPER